MSRSILGQQKRRLKAALFSLLKDYSNGKRWSKEQLQNLNNQIADLSQDNEEFVLRSILEYENKFRNYFQWESPQHKNK